MTETFANIPSHPLIVHAPIVLVPLSLLLTVLMVVVPNLRRRYGALAVGILTLAMIGTFLAARSGKALERQYTSAGRPIPDLLHDHAAMGDRLRFLVAVYLVLTIVWIIRSRRVVPIYGEDGSPSRRPQVISLIVVVLVLAAGTLSTVSTWRTGTLGSRSVWEQDSGG